MLYRYSNAQIWSRVGYYSKALAKGALTTTWIWNLHADAHDYSNQPKVGRYLSNQISSVSQNISLNIARKVFSSNLAHLSIVFFWLSGMHFHGAYYSNFMSWLKDPQHSSPIYGPIWQIVRQQILNADGGGYQGIYMTSGFFQLWLSEGITTSTQLKYGSIVSLSGSILTLVAAYFHMHIIISLQGGLEGIYKKVKSIVPHHLIILFGLGSLSWSGHQIHIARPLNMLLSAGIDPILLPQPEDLLSKDVMESFSSIDLVFYSFKYLESSAIFNFIISFSSRNLNTSSVNLSLDQVSAHHAYLGLVCIVSGVIASRILQSSFLPVINIASSWHAQLALNLSIIGSLSIVISHHLYAIPVYPYLIKDYPTLVCLFCHHMWLGSLFIIGGSAHASIYMLADNFLIQGLTSRQIKAVNPSPSWSYVSKVICQRDLILGHLIWISIALGMHSFGLYIHNDTLQALGRIEDTFSDTSIQLKPVFAVLSGLAVKGVSISSNLDLYVANRRVITLSQELGTSDFLIHHIHAFTIHTTLLILAKGILYSRSSRLVVDKHQLGFRYPCDGPGRGGTCQISPWDHIYLGIFWMYNSISIIIFHYYWKMQSDVWCLSRSIESSKDKIVHIRSGDFNINSNTINGWLRNFLWSQSAQVIQSYSTSVSGYGLIFLLSHFIWAFSLMFLYSGRGYWQELIESILWSHTKLKVVPLIQARALSISQGRAVGLTHYILGGIGRTWSFFIARMVALTS